MMLHSARSKSDWLFNAQSRELPADWLILEISEKATLNIKMTWWQYALTVKHLDCMVACPFAVMLCYVNFGNNSVSCINTFYNILIFLWSAIVFLEIFGKLSTCTTYTFALIEAS